MKNHFELIEDWLKKNAEKIATQSLQNPATSQQIDDLEELIGKNLPEDFKELYLWHNGLSEKANTGSLFFGMDFIPIERVIEDHKRWLKDRSEEKVKLEKADKEIDPNGFYSHGWIRFAFDGSHTGLYLDLIPNKEGKYGQIIFVDDEYETAILVAPSTIALIEQFNYDLQSGLYHLHEDALEDDNHFLEADAKIDIINWQMSEKWQR